MEPVKKKNTWIVYVFLLLFALYIAVLGADETAALSATEEEMLWLYVIMGMTNRLFSPFPLSFNEYTIQWVAACVAIWGLGILLWESLQRNYIKGKEYGTSVWGSKKDIEDLFADNICKEEIQEVKRRRTPWGLRKDRKKVYKQCEKNGKEAEKAKIDAIPSGLKRKERKAEVQKIQEETKQEVALTKIQSWEPDRLKKELNETLTEIDSDASLGEEEKAERKRKAEKDYKEGMNTFRSPAGKIEKLRKKYENADMILTDTEHISIYNYKLNNNTIILGGSGSGKTRSYVLPNILQAHSSWVITDPKGEILEKTGYFLSEVKGYKIRVLNLDDKASSDGYNPFVYIHPERPGYEERVLSLIETIIVNTDGGERKGSSDPFWDKAERLFLQAIFFFTCEEEEEDRNMSTVLDLIGKLQIEEEEDECDSELDHFVDDFALKHGEDHIGVQQYREFRSKASGKTAKSIVISAVARLAPFRASEVKRIFSYDAMDLDRLGEEKMAVFVVVPPTDPSFNFIAGMLFTQMFQELQYCASQVHKHDGQRLPVPVRFLLDEFANTCTIPNFTQILAYARSFGIGITPVLQSLEQIKKMYKDEWGTIIDNCNTLLFLGSITHMDTLEYMSKLLGKGTYMKQSYGKSKGKGGSTSTNDDVIGRELMDPSEIRKLKKENCLLVVGGRNPFYSKKYEYKNHPNYKFTSDANPAYSYTYMPQPPPLSKKERMAKERETREQAATEIEAMKERAMNSISITDNSIMVLQQLTSGEEMTTETELLSDVGEWDEEDTETLFDALFDENVGIEITEDEEEILKVLEEEEMMPMTDEEYGADMIDLIQEEATDVIAGYEGMTDITAEYESGGEDMDINVVAFAEETPVEEEENNASQIQEEDIYAAVLKMMEEGEMTPMTDEEYGADMIDLIQEEEEESA